MQSNTLKWKGIDRTKIKWHPILDKKKCTGCGMCITSCGKNVFDFDKAEKKCVVARPLQCMVGCSSCESWCVFDAISFPDKKQIKELIKKNKILKIAKKELEQRLNTKPCGCTG